MRSTKLSGKGPQPSEDGTCFPLSLHPVISYHQHRIHLQTAGGVSKRRFNLPEGISVLSTLPAHAPSHRECFSRLLSYASGLFSHGPTPSTPLASS